MNLSKKEIRTVFTEIFFKTEGNIVSPENALPGCAGLTIYDPPLIGFASADDPLFDAYRDPEIIGPPYLHPKEWLSEAKTVVSFFLPFTEDVRKANRDDPEHTANAWLHGRIEGQAFISSFTEALSSWFASHGIEVCVPASDSRFSTAMQPVSDTETGRANLKVSSAWSERHAAYAAGLGTFSLTRALISERGMAGRYGSLIVSAHTEPDIRSYSGIYDYCIRCGACVKRCPAGAISHEHGKDQMLCGTWVMGTKEKYAPRYGCGKCQVGVPCEARNPSKAKVEAGK